MPAGAEVPKFVLKYFDAGLWLKYGRGTHLQLTLGRYLSTSLGEVPIYLYVSTSSPTS